MCAGTERFRERILRPDSAKDKAVLQAFLAGHGLTLDREMEYSVALVDDDGKLAATGSFAGRVLKCIAVDREYQSFGLAAKVITHLVNEEYRRGRTHLFMFTKPEFKRTFSALGFHPVAEVPPALVLLDNQPDGMRRYLQEIFAETGDIAPSGAVVVNCNPFTLGHRHLIEYAAARCAKLHVFVVWEEQSIFPPEVRYALVKQGISHLSNVVMHPGRDYVISQATFPSYFMKTCDEWAEHYARLDLTLFARFIAPHLQIRKRFVGEEPFSAVTAVYNQVMKGLLPPCGIEVDEIPRWAAGGKAVSASRVRALLALGDLHSVKELVPAATYRFLQTVEGASIIQRIREGAHAG